MEASYDQLQEIMIGYLSSKEQEKVHKAYLYASLAHDGQIRKSGEPYIIHPVAVTKILAEQSLPSSVLMAGLLHDVVEDTAISDEDIRRDFGEDVASIVSGVTKLGNIDGLSNDQVQAENHRKIIMATAKDIRVILVKLADRVHNMSTIRFMNESKQKIIAAETLEVYTPIAHRLGMYRMKWELEDLSFKCINKEAYNDIANKLNMKRSERENIVEYLVKEAKDILSKNGIDAHVYGRTKHIYSIYTSMQKRQKSFEELTDLFAFRIIVSTIPQCYSVLGLIHENFKPIPLRFKDYIPTPKHNMYQSIHTTVLTSDGISIEFQIRTKEMERVAEHGIAAHWMYKDNGDASVVQEDIDEQLTWLKKAVENIDEKDSSKFMLDVKEDYLSKSLIVYTPKGDVIEIPEGSTVLDFAYHVHTNIGHHAVSAKVNNNVVSLFYPLKIGDVVHVITSKVAAPTISSIHKVKTSRARDSLKKYFKNMERQNIRNEGYKILINTGLQKNIMDIKKLLADENMDIFYDNFKLSSRDEFLYEVGIGEISINQVFDLLTSKVKKIEKNNIPVVVRNVKVPFYTSMCRYCSPLPGDEIFATKNNVATQMQEYYIHRLECSTKLEKFDATWTEHAENKKYISRLIIEISDEPNSITKVLSVLTRHNNNITSIYFRAGIDTVASGRISVEYSSLKQYQNIYEELIQMDNVIEINRIIDRSLK